MKAATLLFAAIAALMAVSSTAWPFWWHPHPHYPLPPQAPAPSSPSYPPVEEMIKCYQAIHDSSAVACYHYSYDAGKCCGYLSGMVDACPYLPYFKTPFFQGIAKHVCDGASAPSPTS